MTDKSVQVLTHEIVKSSGVNLETAAIIAMDFLTLDISLHESPGRGIEKTYMTGIRPGVDICALRLFVKNKYSLTDKQSIAVAKGLKYKCDGQRDINRVLETGATEATWTFRSTCPWRDDHPPLNGTKFTLASGLVLGDGTTIRPGDQWLCACDFRMVIPERKELKVSAMNKLWRSIKNIFNKKPSQQARLTIEARAITKSKASDKKPT